ncbi:hypothetical protein KC19_VG210100 [Ceratodon purpureus]|uniref:Uncharacterized protein n=1 Tax=Ceratodon purpureus TaxID=3225 RepID=A0A8T0HS24_CERPU|nr:hypothetical protein KC19_VG210100 [Ceratodon purpureus]
MRWDAWMGMGMLVSRPAPVVTLASVPGVDGVTVARSYGVTVAGATGGKNRDGRGGARVLPRPRVLAS